MLCLNIFDLELPPTKYFSLECYAYLSILRKEGSWVGLGLDSVDKRILQHVTRQCHKLQYFFLRESQTAVLVRSFLELK